jgi:hypothetical protein
VAVHIGWRKRADDLRVAVAIGEDGQQFELTHGAEELGWIDKYADLQSIRDTRFNAIMPEFRLWLKSLIAPEWFVAATETASHWRSQSRLAGVFNRWRHNRFDGDEQAFAAVKAWHAKDKHLWLWQVHGNAKQQRRRADRYRNWVAMLAKRYSRVSIADFDLRPLLEKEAVDEAVVQTSRHRQHARLASTGKLREYFKESFVARTVVVKSENITKQCQNCCHVEDLDRVKLIVTCSACGVAIDQDVRGSLNQLTIASGEVNAKSRESLATDTQPGLTSKNEGPKMSKRQAGFVAARKRRSEAKRSNDLQ